jgi:alpha(1,3/1,4) fucosyltransferase
VVRVVSHDMEIFLRCKPFGHCCCFAFSNTGIAIPREHYVNGGIGSGKKAPKHPIIQILPAHEDHLGARADKRTCQFDRSLVVDIKSAHPSRIEALGKLDVSQRADPVKRFATPQRKCDYIIHVRAPEMLAVTIVPERLTMVENRKSKKPQIRVAFKYFWPTFDFHDCFPSVYDKYDFLPSPNPEVIFYSVFTPQFSLSDNRNHSPLTRYPAGDYVRVFITGENFEPDLTDCEFAITFSVLVDHPNHLRLPLWVYENRSWGYGPERLVKDPNTDWQKLARQKTSFCNFIYRQPVSYRDTILQMLKQYKHVDSAGPHLNNLSAWTVPKVPNRLIPKINFLQRFKFTLAIENSIWPGYMTEKLVDPMYAASLPIYVGDPKAMLTFNPDSYIDFSCFANMKEMIEFVREVDNDDELYLRMLAAPFYRDNAIPKFARDDTIRAFFDRIAQAVFARR